LLVSGLVERDGLIGAGRLPDDDVRVENDLAEAIFFAAEPQGFLGTISVGLHRDRVVMIIRHSRGLPIGLPAITNRFGSIVRSQRACGSPGAGDTRLPRTPRGSSGFLTEHPAEVTVGLHAEPNAANPGTPARADHARAGVRLAGNAAGPAALRHAVRGGQPPGNPGLR